MVTPFEQELAERERELGLRRTVMRKVLELMSAALSLVAALAWNDAVQTLFSKIFGPAVGVVAKFLYAILVTSVAVFVILRLTRVSAALEKKNSNK